MSESSPIDEGVNPTSLSHAASVSLRSTLGKPLAKPKTPIAMRRFARALGAVALIALRAGITALRPSKARAIHCADLSQDDPQEHCE